MTKLELHDLHAKLCADRNFYEGFKGASLNFKSLVDELNMQIKTLEPKIFKHNKK